MENPKYYKCIRTNSSNFTVTKIYQIINPNKLEQSNNFIDNVKQENGYGGINYKYFTPSTEHEWNLQEGIITPISKENHSQLSFILKKYNIK